MRLQIQGMLLVLTLLKMKRKAVERRNFLGNAQLSESCDSEGLGDDLHLEALFAYLLVFLMGTRLLMLTPALYLLLLLILERWRWLFWTNAALFWVLFLDYMAYHFDISVCWVDESSFLEIIRSFEIRFIFWSWGCSFILYQP